MVGRLRQLVGGATTASAPAPAPMLASRVTVSSNPPGARSRPRPHLPKTVTAGRRKAIPMPGDTSPTVGDDDENFKNF